MGLLMPALSDADESTLIRAYDTLERPGFAVKISNVVGTPIEMALKMLPGGWYKRLHRHAEAGIAKSLEIAIRNVMLTPTVEGVSKDRRYRTLGMATGALGGLLGAPALMVELPVTTTLMLSTIADIARSEGEDLDSHEGRLACLEVFALGGQTEEDDATDTGYYGLRLALEAQVANASQYLARSSLGSTGSAPGLINLINTLSRRFGLVLSQKTTAELIPIIGAAGGALVNRVFMKHFQDIAHSHFAIRRLERQYGPAVIQAAYARIKTRHPAPAASLPPDLPQATDSNTLV